MLFRENVEKCDTNNKKKNPKTNNCKKDTLCVYSLEILRELLLWGKWFIMHPRFDMYIDLVSNPVLSTDGTPPQSQRTQGDDLDGSDGGCQFGMGGVGI